MRHRISIRGSVRPSILPSVRPSVRPSDRPSVRYASSDITQMTHLVARLGLFKVACLVIEAMVQELLANELFNAWRTNRMIENWLIESRGLKNFVTPSQ